MGNKTFFIGKQMEDKNIYVAAYESEEPCTDEDGKPICMFLNNIEQLENGFCKIYCSECVCIESEKIKKLPSEKQINLIITLCNDKNYKYDLYNLTKGDAIMIIHYLCYGGEKPECFDLHIFN